MQWGEQAGGWQVLVVVEQTRDPQSPLIPQALPGLQFGEQLGAAQVPLVHTRDPQSSFAPHAVSWLQLGAQPGAVHTVFTHEAVAHWLLFVQAVPLGHAEFDPQLTEQLSPIYPTAQVQTPALHVPWPEQVGPPGQVTEQSAPEYPPAHVHTPLAHVPWPEHAGAPGHGLSGVADTTVEIGTTFHAAWLLLAWTQK